MSRAKGHRFERWVRDQFREAYPFLERVERTQQAREASDSDVGGVPGLWIECQDATQKASSPERKLLQAERDVAALKLEHQRIPIAVTHVTGTRKDSTQVTLRARHLVMLATNNMTHLTLEADAMVSLKLSDFLAMADWYVRLNA